MKGVRRYSKGITRLICILDSKPPIYPYITILVSFEKMYLQFEVLQHNLIYEDMNLYEKQPTLINTFWQLNTTNIENRKFIVHYTFPNVGVFKINNNQDLFNFSESFDRSPCLLWLFCFCTNRTRWRNSLKIASWPSHPIFLFNI